MKVIGLCGGSGSGKGEVARLFLRKGIPSIDTDAVYREITSHKGECLSALALEFSEDILTHDGKLNRPYLANLVFSDKGGERLSRLNEITHKYILDETRRRLKHYSDIGINYAIVDAPALFESGFDRECELIISVIAERERRIERIISRDGIDRCRAESRINSQISDGELIKRSDIVIYNLSDLDELSRQVDLAYEKMININER